jgi:1,2-diacylglycerol 3-alpha-glucosyltransferase
MRVLYITDCYYPRVNGVATSIRNFMVSLKEIGVEVKLVAPLYGDEPFDFDTFRVPSRVAPFSGEDRMMRWTNLRNVMNYCSLQDARFDLVHIQTPFAAHYAGVAFARKMKIPAVATYHTFFEHYFHEYARWLPRWMGGAIARSLARSQARDVQAVIAPSHQASHVLCSYGVSAPIRVIPTGLPPSAFVLGDAQKFRDRFDIPTHRSIVLYVGRVAREKNIPFLLQVLKRLKSESVSLVIAGDGPASESVMEQARDLGVSVYHLGYLDQASDLRDAYAAADVFVSASTSETQGLAILEAQAQGTPIVIPHGAEPDLDTFTRAVRRCIEKPYEARMYAFKANREAAWEFSSTAMAMRMRDLYFSLLT